MHVLVCRESGLDCDFIIRGDTKEEFLKNGADHAIEQHGINANDIYLNDTTHQFIMSFFQQRKPLEIINIVALSFARSITSVGRFLYK